MPLVTRHLTIKGRVQGVGFRWSLMAEAERLALGGWVRNRSDGSVEARVRGTAEAVDALTAWAHCGPPAARVDRLTCVDEPDDPTLGGFVQRPTA